MRLSAVPPSFIEMSDHTFNIIVVSWIAFAFIIFLFLFKITPAYGRYVKKSWGPMINNRLGWILMEAPSLLIMMYFFWITTNYENNIIVVAFTFWIIHYINRTLIFPFRINTSGKKMPLLIVLFAIFFNLVNATLNGYWMAFMTTEGSTELFNNPNFIIGADLFILGFIINLYHDNILIKLRKFGSGYKIPTKGWFKYVSCPNYLGEIIEWTGFVILVWSLPALSFLIWTLANLLPRAIRHHKWYHEKFEHYPSGRKAIFPYIL